MNKKIKLLIIPMLIVLLTILTSCSSYEKYLYIEVIEAYDSGWLYVRPKFKDLYVDGKMHFTNIKWVVVYDLGGSEIKKIIPVQPCVVELDRDGSGLVTVDNKHIGEIIFNKYSSGEVKQVDVKYKARFEGKIER